MNYDVIGSKEHHFLGGCDNRLWNHRCLKRLPQKVTSEVTFLGIDWGRISSNSCSSYK